MMVLDFTTLVANQIAAIQALATPGINFAVGSILRAFVESNCAIAIWLQSLLIQILALSRAATSNGQDLDSWMGDFGVVRIGAIPATGSVTFARFTPSTQAVIPLGATIEDSTSGAKFVVVLDTTNTAYNSQSGGYVVLAGTTSITVAVVCTVSGSIGNSLAGNINTLTLSISGIDTVTNAANFDTGFDTETDAQFRLRFQNTISSVSKATKTAMAGAVATVSPNLSFNIVENQNFDGSSNDGYFYVVVDDGTGNPSSTLLSEISAVVELTRPLTSKYDVFPPVVQNVNITLDIITPKTLSHSDLVATAQAAVIAYVNGLGLGNSLSYTMLSSVVYASDPNILNVVNVSVNNGTQDILPSTSTTLKAGIVVVN